MLNEHFGRAQVFDVFRVEADYFILQKSISMDKVQHLDESIAARLKCHGVDLVICGSIGAGALNGLTKTGLQVICGASGRVHDVIEAFVAGKLTGNRMACDCTRRTDLRRVECLCNYAAEHKR